MTPVIRCPRTVLVRLILTALGVVLLPGDAAAGQERWQLREDLRIGALEGPAALTRVGAVLPSPDGQRVYVAQLQEQTIRVFDTHTGEPLGTLGRSGAGPGEFQRVGKLSWRGDMLYATDAFQQRMVVFSPEGEHVETFKVVAPVVEGVRRPPLPSTITPAGTIWGRPTYNLISVARGMVSHDLVALMSREGEILGSVAPLPLPGAAVAEFEGGVSVFFQPLVRPARVEIAENGSALAVVRELPKRSEEGRFSVTRISHQLDTVFHRTYRYTPREISDAARDSIFAAAAETMFQRAGGRALAVAREHFVVPELQPPVTGVLVDATGRTWIRREELRPTPRWVVLNESGEVEGVLDVDPDVEIRHVRGNTVWGVVKDEWDVPYVVRYRLIPVQ